MTTSQRLDNIDQRLAALLSGWLSGGITEAVAKDECDFTPSRQTKRPRSSEPGKNEKSTAINLFGGSNCKLQIVKMLGS
jgi:hypothetical protein